MSIAVVGLVAFAPAEIPASRPAVTLTREGAAFVLRAHDSNLLDVLRETGRHLGFSVIDLGTTTRRLTIEVRASSPEDLLRQLLREESYTVIFRAAPESSAAIESVVVLPAADSNAAAPAETVMPAGARPAGGGVDHDIAGRTEGSYEPLDAPMSAPGTPRKSASRTSVVDVAEDPRSQSPDPPPRDAFAMPFRIPAPSVAAVPSDLPPEEALPLLTRIAREKVKALVEALTTAEQSLIESVRHPDR